MKFLGWAAALALALIPVRALLLIAYKTYLGYSLDFYDAVSIVAGGVGAWLSYTVYKTLTRKSTQPDSNKP